MKGTVIGFRCPQYFEGINVPGYHFHFLTEDRKAGGHILELITGKDTLDLDKTSNYSLLLPENEEFYNLDLTPDKGEILEQVERNKKDIK